MNQDYIPASRSGVQGNDTTQKFKGRHIPSDASYPTSTATGQHGDRQPLADVLPQAIDREPKTGDMKLLAVYATGGLLGLLGPHKNDPDVRYHSYQALFTSIAAFAVHAVLGILGGKFLLLQDLSDLAASGFGIYQLYRAYHGMPFDIPFISDIARKQAELPSENRSRPPLQ